MPNPFIPREQIHAWSEDIGQRQGEHEAALNRLLKQHRRVSRFVEENQDEMGPGGAGISLYLISVILRMYDLAGGRMKGVTWRQLRAASARVGEVAGDVLPRDEDFADRVRGVSWRAQPHILDEAILALFERDRSDDEAAQVADEEAVKIFFLMWVVNEVMDANWTPPSSFVGEESYRYVHIEPPTPSGEDEE